MSVDFETLGLHPVQPAPSPRQVDWFQRERTAFFHFNMNTFTGQEWGDGTEKPAQFCPQTVDCRQWARAAREAGFTVGILTAKHHDGFCLWPSAYTEHCIRNSPYKDGKGDIVREFTDACREYGLRVGLYLSPWDRHEPCWGTEEYNDHYAAQLTELMTGYGPIAECWWDGAGSEKAHYDWGRWAYIIRCLQPECVIYAPLYVTPYVDTRWVGNEGGYAGDPCWATVQALPGCPETREALNAGQADGNGFIPAECDVSIRPGWFYHPEQNSEVKSVSWLVQYWFDSVGRNSGMLLNLPPMPDGRLHQTDVDNSREAYQILRSTFARNLAAGAAVTADSLRDDRCSPDKLLLDDPERFYAAAEGDTALTVELQLPRAITFDCFRLGEMIQLGHRVRGFAIDAMTDSGWKTLAQGECVGYLYARRLPDPVTADRLRVRITAADAAPVLREFGVYRLPDGLFEEEKVLRTQQDLAAGASARVSVSGEETVINLGGIYPYNTVVFDSCGSMFYTVYAFNGTEWETCCTGRPAAREIARFRTVEGSYQLKVVLRGVPDAEIHPQVFCL